MIRFLFILIFLPSSLLAEEFNFDLPGGVKTKDLLKPRDYNVTEQLILDSPNDAQNTNNNNTVETNLVPGTNFTKICKASRQDLLIDGDALICLSNITGQSIVNGSLIIDQSQIDKIKVKGKSNISNTVIKKIISNSDIELNNSTVLFIDNFGELTINNSKIGDIYTNSNNFLINNSETGDIYVRDTASKPQNIIITNKSKVNGSIVFASGKGKVKISQDSITSSTINGGILEK